ncbi:MAG: phosphoribosylglycinamide formyltransferase [Ignavibacteriae bacterium]|nr:phosphoribosylglycinamide formyltransferase [Ignavibacteriota bacterium]
MLNLAIFASGNGSNFRSIHRAVSEGRLAARIVLLVTDKATCGAVTFATAEGIPTRILTSEDLSSPARGAILLEATQRHGADFIALCGYLKLLPAEFVRAFANRILNIHPALLPAFGGKGMYGTRVHVAVLESGAKFSGPTVHLVDEEYDRGPIVAQRVVPVHDDDTVETLAARVLTEEHLLYPAVLQAFSEGRVTVSGSRTYILEHPRT